MLGRDVLVLELVGLLAGRVEDLAQGRRERRLPSPADLGQALEGGLDVGADLGRRRADLGQDGVDDVLVLGEEAGQQVLGPDLLVAHLLGPRLGLLDGLLGHDGELIPTHRYFLPGYDPFY